MCVCGGVGSVHVCVGVYHLWPMGYGRLCQQQFTYICSCFLRLKSIFKRSVTWIKHQQIFCEARGFIWFVYVDINDATYVCVPPFVLYYWVHTAGMYLIELEVGPEVVLPRRHTDSVNNLSEKRDWGCWSVGWFVNHVMQHCNALVNGSVCIVQFLVNAVRCNPVKKVICPGAYTCACVTRLHLNWYSFLEALLEQRLIKPCR